MELELNETATEGVVVVELDARPMLSIRTTIVAKELGERMGEKFEALSGYMQKLGIKPAAQPFVRYHTFDWEGDTDFEVGVPVEESVEGEGWIESGALPGGPAVWTVHKGPHEELGKAYDRINGWLKENEKVAASPLWEIYYWIDLGKGDEEGEGSNAEGGKQWVGLVQPYK